MATLAGLCTLAFAQAAKFPATFEPWAAASNTGSHKLNQFMSETAGVTLFLIPDNNFRPTTIDSAIYKGGMDVTNMAWGASPFIQAMFPDRWYVVADGPAYSKRPVDLSPYDKLVFVSSPGGRAAALQHLSDVFGVTTDGFDCSFEADLLYYVAVGCRRQRAGS